MEKLLIKGGNQLSGKITCSGAKNAALPMIASTILSDEKVTLKNLPYYEMPASPASETQFFNVSSMSSL